MQNSGNQNKPEASSGGWVVETRHGYYTGSGHSHFERWTPFRKFAKIYQRRGWAQKIAAKFEGQIIPVK